jgi:hypothetical protein
MHDPGHLYWFQTDKVCEIVRKKKLERNGGNIQSGDSLEVHVSLA